MCRQRKGQTQKSRNGARDAGNKEIDLYRLTKNLDLDNSDETVLAKVLIGAKELYIFKKLCGNLSKKQRQ